MFRWFHRFRWSLWVALALLAGLGIRLYDLTDPPLDFHPARQMHSAILARGYYAEAGGYSGWEGDMARGIAASEAIIEPPLLEKLVGWTYTLLGGEVLWAARVYSTVFWLAAAWFVYDLGRRLSGQAGGAAALAFYVFLPYAVFASRSFQPDPLMTALMTATLWLLTRWAERPAWKWAVWAGLAGGAAILVKQVAVFMVGLAALAAVWRALGPRRAPRDPQVWGMAALMLAPVAAYNVYGLYIQDFLAGQYSLRFFPAMYVDPAFYIRWANQINQTVGMLPFALALAGLALAFGRERASALPAWLLAGWGVGYVLYGYAFAHHISSHDYYQLPLIPWAALGLAPAAQALWDAARSRPARWALSGAALVAVAFSLWTARSTLHNRDFRAEPAVWAELGARVNHDPARLVALMEDYGARVTYWGYVLPARWPGLGDLAMHAAAGQAVEPAEFEPLVTGKDFFIVTDFPEFDRQPALRETLERHYGVALAGPGYRVYDLRTPPQ